MLPTDPLPLAAAPDRCRCQAVTHQLLRSAVAGYVGTTRILWALSTVPAAMLAESDEAALLSAVAIGGRASRVTGISTGC